MTELLLQRRESHERCPYCHDGLDEVERLVCVGCGTPHHPVCLEELGGCTVLGCDAGVPAVRRGPPPGTAEELRERVRARAERYRATQRQRADAGGETPEAVAERMASQPDYCPECENAPTRPCSRCGALPPARVRPHLTFWLGAGTKAAAIVFGFWLLCALLFLLLRIPGWIG